MPRESFTDNCPGCYQPIPSGLQACPECGLEFSGLKQATFIARDRNDLKAQIESFLADASTSGDIQIVTIDDRALEDERPRSSVTALVGTVHYRKRTRSRP